MRVASLNQSRTSTPLSYAASPPASHTPSPISDSLELQDLPSAIPSPVPSTSSATLDSITSAPMSREQLIDVLHIDPELATVSDNLGATWSLCLAYKKFLAIEEAKAHLSELQKQGQLRNIKIIHITDLFIKKTAYYGNWNKIFPHVQCFPGLHDWLINAPHAPTTTEVWGDDNNKRTFNDLHTWLEKEGVITGGNRGRVQVISDQREREREQQIEEECQRQCEHELEENRKLQQKMDKRKKKRGDKGKDKSKDKGKERDRGTV